MDIFVFLLYSYLEERRRRTETHTEKEGGTVMDKLYIVIKLLLVSLSVLSIGFAPMSEGGDLTGDEAPPPGDPDVYVQIAAKDEGTDTWRPSITHGGYRYGPSMILNADGSLDVWSASTGPGDLIDLVSYKRLYDGGKSRTKETIALKPTPESLDQMWTCDPGVIKFGGYYYIGYTTTKDARGTDNDVCVARSKSPDGPFLEKWTGSGWGTLPVPLVEYTGNPDCFGAGEPSFVLLGGTLYIYYSWCDENGASTRVATADATDENWPATLQHHGECIPPKKDGDSADVKYADEYGRFIAVFTEKRFSDDSYVAVWESFDGLRFRPSGFVKANTAKKLHNCGISGRADGHICAGDPVYLSYAYGGAGDGSWGNWATRIHEVSLSAAAAPELNDAAVENADIAVTRRADRLLPEVVTVKAEKQVYTVEKSQQVFVMAYDSDNYVYPVLTGATFDGYDESVIRIVGGRICVTGEGTTRVTVHWHGLSGDFVVHAAPNT